MYYFSRKEIERTRGLLSGYDAELPEGAEPKTEESMAENLSSGLGSLIRYAALDPKEARKELSGTLILLLIVLAFAVISARPLAFLLVPALLLVQFMRLRGRGITRAQAFEKDYTALLLSLAAAVRTGLDPLTALLQSAELFSEDSEVRKELVSLKNHVDKGASEESAILGFASTINHPDIQLFRTAFMLSRREGSSLSGCLQRLAKVTRQRQSFRRKIKSAVALQKLSAIGIAVCTGLIGLIQWSANSKAVVAALEHPIGFRILAGGSAAILIGLIWMFTMTRSRL